jgi:hypothetical protein
MVCAKPCSTILPARTGTRRADTPTTIADLCAINRKIPIISPGTATQRLPKLNKGPAKDFTIMEHMPDSLIKPESDQPGIQLPADLTYPANKHANTG